MTKSDILGDLLPILRIPNVEKNGLISEVYAKMS